MREIKFRAWDEESKEIIELYQINPDEEYQYYVDDKSSHQRCKTNTLMQYTGLRDKNGVEIYEGDIVVQKSIYGAPKNTGEIVFEFARFTIKVKDGYSSFNPEVFECEILGNIYENPNLLTK